MKKTIDRADVLKKMNENILFTDDFQIIDTWQMNAVPDCADRDDLEEIASDTEFFNGICELYEKLIKKVLTRY